MSMDRFEKFSDKLLNAAYWILRVVGVGIFLALSFYSLRYSHYMRPGAAEVSIEQQDALWQQLLALAILLALALGLRIVGNRLTQRAKFWVERAFLVFSMLWIFGWGFWWITSLERIPEGDQAFIYGGASYFLEGDFHQLQPSGYFGMYPHQLGLIALVELLFLIVGTYNYFAYEIICVILAAGIAGMGYLFLKELKAPFGARILYFLLIVNCIPLVCYTSWVYGDVPSIFFTILAAYCMVRYHNRQKWYALAGMVASVTMAVLVRKNSMIFLVALCILALLYAMKNRKLQMLIALLLALLCPFLCYQGIYKVYEIRSGYSHSEGLPVSSWIAMGMQENRGMCGWYNVMPIEVFYSLSGDYDATREAVKEIIRERFSYFRQNPGYAVEFYKKKILSQWNAPLYQSVYFSAKYQGEDKPAEGSLLEKIYQSQKEFYRMFGLANSMQFLIYLGILFYFLFAVKKQSQPLEHLLAVTLIGGFFFSILWEAKARYIFVYYVTMYPLAAIGYYRMLETAERVWAAWKSR